MPAIDTERDPARHVAELDAAQLLGRHDGSVENVKAVVGAVGQPQFLFIRRQAYAVTRAPVALHRPLLKVLDLHPVQHLARAQIANFETEQVVHVDKAEGPASVDRERPDNIAEGADRLDSLLSRGVRHRKKRRAQAGQIRALSVAGTDRVMRTGLRHDLRNNIAADGINYVPKRPFERRYIKRLAVWRDRHPVAPAFIGPVPNFFLRDDIESRHAVERADVDFPGLRARRDALYVFGLFAVRHVPRRYAFDESIALVDV